MKNIKLIGLFGAITTIMSCSSSDVAPSKTAPILTTSAISNVTLNSASSGGNVSDDGEDAVIARGIVWNSVTSPTTSLTSKTTDGSGLGNFSSSVSNLLPSNTYFVRAYATNSIGTGYGNEISFTTGAVALPTLSTTAITSITTNSAVSGGNIIADGGGTITARGLVWSKTSNPTIDLATKTADGSGTGVFTSNISELSANATYFVKAYATNSAGTTYGNEVNFTTQNINYSTLYPSGTVFCDNVVTAVIDVTNPVTGKTWMDRNLGASQVATSSTDALAYGDLYQWGRGSDGHQCRNSNKITTRSSTDQPGHGDFILTLSPPEDWRSSPNENLWQGLNGINNPCPSNYRLPTDTEWKTELASWSSNNQVGAFSSQLKLPVAGRRYFGGGRDFDGVGEEGDYWASTITTYSDTMAVTPSFSSYNGAFVYENSKSWGRSVRCIKD
ncbi:hypothetical protein [Flavobacterium sp. W22_SRS_FP1]|uniref:hypothetical protein n=1 Tax=Flavobacterium sp. W22_SRS_FP1 TaxID=3240276 RepID=UPI003F8EC6DE